MQDHYREEVDTYFDNLLGEVPLFEEEVRGLQVVSRVTDKLFAVA